jgi:hypothetical protein
MGDLRDLSSRMNDERMASDEWARQKPDAAAVDRLSILLSGAISDVGAISTALAAES